MIIHDIMSNRKKNAGYFLVVHRLVFHFFGKLSVLNRISRQFQPAPAYTTPVRQDKSHFANEEGLRLRLTHFELGDVEGRRPKRLIHHIIGVH